MKTKSDRGYSIGMFLFQIVSLSMIWVFVTGIAIWILNLISLSLELDDALGATVGISLIAVPVFLTLASILTYVFIGLQQEAFRIRKESSSEN